MRRAPRCARSQIGRGPVGPFAADVLLRGFTHLALSEARYRRGNTVRDPVNYPESASPFRIDHNQREAFSSRRRIGPSERRRDIFADAVRIVLPIAGILFLQRRTVLECRGRQCESFSYLGVLNGALRRREHGNDQAQTFDVSMVQHNDSSFN